MTGGALSPLTDHADDPVVASASAVLSGPRGRYAVPMGLRRRAAMYGALSAIPVGAAALMQTHCVQAGWDTPDQFWHMCFSDLTNTYRDGALGDGIAAYLHGGMASPAPNQPALTGLVMTALGSLPSVSTGSSVEQMRGYLLIWAALVAALMAATAALTALTTRFAPERAALVAFSPVVALVALISPDALGVALVAAAMWFWSRGRPVGTGVLLGLAIAARSYPVLVVIAAVLLSLRAGRRQVAGRVAVSAVVSAGAVVGGLSLLNSTAATASYVSWATSGAGFGSPWVLPMLAGHPLSSTAVSALTVGGWIAAVVVGAILALAAPARPSLWEVSAVMVGIVLVTGASFPVQSSLWLVPLVALVGLPWRDVLVWGFVEAVHFVAVWLHIAAQSVADRGLPGQWYAVFLILRLAVVIYLVHAVWRAAMRRRITWPVVVDPEDGPLSGRPDSFVVAFR